jgi:enoyl-CoA hydratase
MMTCPVRITKRKSDQIWIVTIDRVSRKNSVDPVTASALHTAFSQFDADPVARVAILHGAGGNFCAGADLKSIAEGKLNNLTPSDANGEAPMGPTRLLLSKPTIAAVEGYAVAGGLELALWCDLRVADPDAIFGVFCRRPGVNLIDGGTVRLPRIVGMGRALDMILTGRPVPCSEALAMGLVSRISEKGKVLEEAVTLAELLCSFPQKCMRADRENTYQLFAMPLHEALMQEITRSAPIVLAEGLDGARRFTSGEGRHGRAFISKL